MLTVGRLLDLHRLLAAAAFACRRCARECTGLTAPPGPACPFCGGGLRRLTPADREGPEWRDGDTGR